MYRILNHFNLDETLNAKRALKYILEALGPKKLYFWFILSVFE